MLARWTVLLGFCVVRGTYDGLYLQDYKTIEERIASTLSYSVSKDRVAKWDKKMQDNGTFDDLKYSIDQKEGKDILEHARRLEDIIQRDLRDYKQLSETTEKSIIFFTYDIPPLISVNLWHHVIGIPNVVWPIVFRARKQLNQTVIYAFLDRYFTKTACGPVWDPTLRHTKNTGANLAPRVRHGLRESFLRERLPAFHEEVTAMLHREFVLRDPYLGNGFRHDGCLHTHNKWYTNKTTGVKHILGQVYNNNYGKEVQRHLPVAMWQLKGTAFELEPEIENSIFNAFFECHQWLFRGPTVEPSTVGRVIDSGTKVTKVCGQHGVEEALEYLGRIPHRSAEVKAAKHRYENVRPEKKYALEGNRYFFLSDLVAHQRQDFMASLRILSRRTVRPETIPPSGSSAAFYKGTPRGYFLGDGFLTVLVSSKELGSVNQEIFQIYDWARVPGVTIQYTTNVPQVSTTKKVLAVEHAYNDVDFAGGVNNRKEGVSAMEYARLTVALSAKKSWFFFDSIILCLGSGVTVPAKNVTAYPVTTTLNQVVYEGSHIVGGKTAKKSHSFGETVQGKVAQSFDFVDGIWLHHGAIGYVPIRNSGKVGLEVEGKLVPTTKTKMHKISMWLDHGPSPSGSSYAYAVLPAHSPTQTQQFANENTATIVSLENAQHAACFEPLKILGVAFFIEGCLDLEPCLSTGYDSVCTDQPALVMLKDLGSAPADKVNCPDGVTLFSSGATLTLQISIADPTQKLSQIDLELKKGETVHDLTVQTTPYPKLGDSAIVCLSLS